MIGEIWERVSPEAKKLIGRMLTYNPEQRITAHDALNDAWIVKYSNLRMVSGDSQILGLKNLQSFKVRSLD